jgi:hypothetical protein
VIERELFFLLTEFPTSKHEIFFCAHNFEMVQPFYPTTIAEWSMDEWIAVSFSFVFSS